MSVQDYYSHSTFCPPLGRGDRNEPHWGKHRWPLFPYPAHPSRREESCSCLGRRWRWWEVSLWFQREKEAAFPAQLSPRSPPDCEDGRQLLPFWVPELLTGARQRVWLLEAAPGARSSLLHPLAHSACHPWGSSGDWLSALAEPVGAGPALRVGEASSPVRLREQDFQLRFRSEALV